MLYYIQKTDLMTPAITIIEGKCFLHDIWREIRSECSCCISPQKAAVVVANNNSRIFSERWIQDSRVSGLLYRYYFPLFIDLTIALPFSLVQYLYVWSVVKRTHGVLPCTLVSVHLAHTYKYRVSTHMQSFCTCVPVAASLFAWLVLIYVITRTYHMNV